ncbi:helicase, partial [Lactiplantibacillus plantarum]|nr:helicase [Lactiplantibacillus plantarum]
AVKKMLDDTVKKTVVNAGLSSERHSEQYQFANRRMYDVKIEPIARTKNPVIPKVSFSTGEMHGVAVLKLSFNDVNQALLSTKNVVVDLVTPDNDGVTNGEHQLHDALDAGLESTFQLDENTAKLSVAALDVTFQRVLERKVAKYNHAINQSEDVIDSLKDHVAEQTAKMIEESVRNPSNHNMIIQKIQEAGLTPKVIGKLVQNMRTIDQDNPLYEDVIDIRHDVNLFWLNFGYYAKQFDLENIELTGKRQLSRMDVRQADVNQSSFKLLLANVVIYRH